MDKDNATFLVDEFIGDSINLILASKSNEYNQNIQDNFSDYAREKVTCLPEHQFEAMITSRKKLIQMLVENGVREVNARKATVSLYYSVSRVVEWGVDGDRFKGLRQSMVDYLTGEA